MNAAYEGTIGANASMEQYQNTLTTVLKSSEKATETLAWAQKFAAETPFEIPDIVEATTRLSAYGMKAQDVMKSTGNMAAVMGKPLMQAVEAVADAQTGELERLKEFGITKQMLIDKAAEMGKKEVVNAKGQITDMQAFNDALFALMDDRFKGGMEIQSKTFDGMISNVKDSIATMGREVSKPIFEKLKQGLQSVLPVIGAFTQTIQGDWLGARDTLTQAFGANTAVKIEVFFTKIYSYFNKAKQFITDLMPTVENVKEIIINIFPLLQDLGLIAGAAIEGAADNLPGILEGVTGVAKGFTEWEGFIPIVEGITAATATYHFLVDVVAKAEELWNKAKKIGIALQIAWTEATIASATAGGGLKGALAGLRAGFLKLNVTMAANPIILIIAILVGLGVALYAAYKKSETFRNFVDKLWASLKEGFFAVINWFTTTLPQWVASVVQWFTEMKDKGVALFSELWSSISSGAQIFFAFIMQILSPFITFFVNSWQNLKLLVLSIVTGFFALLTGDFEGVKLALLGIITAFKNQFINYWELLKSTVLKVAILLWEGIKSGFSSGKDFVINTAVALYNGVINWFKSMYDKVVGHVDNTKTKVSTGFSEAKDAAVNKIEDMYNGVIDWIKSIPGKFIEMKDKIVGTVSGIDLYSMGTNVVQGFIDGIGSMFGKVWGKVKDLGEGLKEKLKNVLDIHSPSRVTMWIGEMLGAGMVDGMDNSLSGILKMSQKLADASVPNLNASKIPNINQLSGLSPVNGTVGSVPLEITIHNYTELDGREVARGTYKHTTEFQQMDSDSNKIFKGRP
nr:MULTISPECIES: tape measure protein [Bacillaceae]